MCISMQSGDFSGTRVYVGELSRDLRSVIYECVATSEKANALIFTVPTRREIEDSDFVNLEAYPSLLKDMKDAVSPPELTRGAFSAKSALGVVEVGQYTVVYSNSASIDAIKALINSPLVREERRPELNYEVIDGLNGIGLPVIIACYAAGKTHLHPFGMTYSLPIYEDKLVVPMLDGHGEFGDPTAYRDHWVFAGSYRAAELEAEMLVTHESAYPLLPLTELEGAFITSMAGKRISGKTANGDYFIDLPKLLSDGEIKGNFAIPTR